MNHTRDSQRRLTPAIATLCLLILPNMVSAEDRAPNVIMILTDDLGWSDTGCYGSEFHKTPNIDRLASEGLKFNQAYSASPLCSPTRASILTGLYPARIGITAPVCHVPEVRFRKELSPGGKTTRALSASSVTRLSTDYYTLGEAFRDGGYRTAHFGKWHLGPEPYSPLEHGFDIDLPHMAGPGPGGANGYFAPWRWWPGEGQRGDHIDDRMAEEAVAFIKENRDRPFYINYWLFGVHSPWMGKEEYIEEAAGRADPASAQRHPVYAAMVRSTDEAIGRVMNVLDQQGLADNTLVILASDNGAWHNVPNNAKGSPYADTPVTSNAPLRSGKASLYEGGTRTPLVIRWPGVTEQGAVTEVLWQSTDFFPTLVDICGLPDEECPEWDGVSQAEFLRGGESPRDTIFCHFPHTGRTDIEGFAAGTSVRRGDWKLCRFFAANDDHTDKLELYNLAADVGESNNVAAQHPALVSELNSSISKFLVESEAVVPTRNPNYRPQAIVVDGWSAQKDARLAKQDTGALRIEVTGSDPILISPKLDSESRGPFEVSVQMRTTCRGPADIYWKPSTGRFSAQHKVSFEVDSDGQDRRYTVEIPAERLGVLRFDPARESGEIVLRAFQVRDNEGQIVAAWPN